MMWSTRSGRTPSVSSPKPPDTRTASCGGSAKSSSAATPPTSSTPSSKRWPRCGKITSPRVYDTSVADLTEDLQDPVDLLFGTQLGGGNDTPRALAYCQSIITRPAETVMVLVTDCYEGGLSEAMLERTARGS